MTRSDRLAPLVDVAAGRVTEAARAVSEARDALARQEARLAELLDYRHHYDQGTTDAALMRSFSLANARAFHAQLDEAVRQQQARVRSAREELERQIEGWRMHKAEEQAMDRLVRRRAGDERRQAERAEQRLADDTGPVRFGPRAEAD